MNIINAQEEDFSLVYKYIETLWDYNTYDVEVTKMLYKSIIKDENHHIVLLEDENQIKGFCHCVLFDTFWMSGMTCYVSGIIVSEGDRHKGYGRKLMDHVVEHSSSAGARAIILDSGLSRVEAHKFYENYGFEKCCYGYEMIL